MLVALLSQFQLQETTKSEINELSTCPIETALLLLLYAQQKLISLTVFLDTAAVHCLVALVISNDFNYGVLHSNLL